MPRPILCAALLFTLVLPPTGAAARARHYADDGAPAPPAAMVSFSPGPGVSFQIPENWIACDDDMQKLLRSAADAMNVKTRFCTISSNVPSKLRAFDPRPLHMLSVIFNWHANQPITEEAMNGIVDADLAQIRQAICDVETKPLTQNGAMTVSCDVAMGMLAGHRAMVSTLIETNPADPKLKIVIDSYEVAYPQGYMQLQFSHPQLLATIVKPLQDRIVASVQISSAGSPPAPAPDAAPAAPDNDASGEDGSQSRHQEAPPATQRPPAPDHSI